MPDSHYVRGSVLKCYFPFDDQPHLPGPTPHYCLFGRSINFADVSLVAVVYGTSRLDDELIRAHQGLIWSVSSDFIKGPMPGKVTHFVADHVALLRNDDGWIRSDFQARLDFMREEKRKEDVQRRRLYDQYVAFSRIVDRVIYDTLEQWQMTGKIGLPPGRKLR